MKKILKPILWTALSVVFTVFASFAGYKIGYKNTEAWINYFDK